MTGFRFLFIAVENGFHVFAGFWASEPIFLQPQLKLLKVESARNLKVLEVSGASSKAEKTQQEESDGTCSAFSLKVGYIMA